MSEKLAMIVLVNYLMNKYSHAGFQIRDRKVVKHISKTTSSLSPTHQLFRVYSRLQIS